MELDFVALGSIYTCFDFVGEVLTEDPCDKCVCANGKVTCQPPDCPIGGLQCVDVQRDANCTYYCPNGMPKNLITNA